MATVEFTLAADGTYLHTRYLGTVRLADVQDALVEGNAHWPGMHSIVDFSDASLEQLSGEDVRALVELAAVHEPHDIRCAFVAPRALEFGLSRMYDMLAEWELPQTRAVFRTLAEAQAWMANPAPGADPAQ